MSSHKQRSRGGRAKNTETYRPWNAAALGKSSLGSTDNSESQHAKPERFDDELMDIDRKFESTNTTQFRPWNTTALNKLDIENESLVVSSTPSQQVKRNFILLRGIAALEIKNSSSF